MEKHKEEKIGLWVDFINSPSQTAIPPVIASWKIIRSYEQFKQWFNDNHYIPELISFNFALSEEYLRYIMLNPVGTPIIYETLGSGSGASCAVFLSHVLSKNNLKAKRICVHGDRNDRGCREIQKFVNSWKEEQDCFMANFDMELPTDEEGLKNLELLKKLLEEQTELEKHV